MPRGRPILIKSIFTEESSPHQFNRVYNDSNGDKTIWNYDLDKQPNGPISVEFIYKKHPTPPIDENQDHLPKSERKYINPHNGKIIGFQRAKMLNLI